MKIPIIKFVSNKKKKSSKYVTEYLYVFFQLPFSHFLFLDIILEFLCYVSKKNGTNLMRIFDKKF